MKDLEKKFFDWVVQQKMEFYGISEEEAKKIVTKQKENAILWKSAFDAWFDEIHCY